MDIDDADESSVLYTQAGAIPYRFGDGNRPEVLLIRKHGKRRWSIPKGLVDPGESMEDTVLKEATEEAGVTGDLSDSPIGYFAFRKWGGVCHVSVYLMRVTDVQAEYPEQHRRDRQWFPVTTAAEVARRKKIRKLILDLPRLLKEQAL